jgi:hypothetical protein
MPSQRYFEEALAERRPNWRPGALPDNIVDTDQSSGQYTSCGAFTESELPEDVRDTPEPWRGPTRSNVASISIPSIHDDRIAFFNTAAGKQIRGVGVRSSRGSMVGRSRSRVRAGSHSGPAQSNAATARPPVHEMTLDPTRRGRGLNGRNCWLCSTKPEPYWCGRHGRDAGDIFGETDEYNCHSDAQTGAKATTAKIRNRFDQ